MLNVDTSYPNGTLKHTPHSAGRHSPPMQSASVPAFPDEITHLSQWMVHTAKVPGNVRTGKNADVKDIDAHGTLSEAMATVARGLADGLSLAFTRDDGLVGIDIDGCVALETGEIDPRAQRIVNRFPGIYWEISKSGTGLHGIGYGSLPTETSGKHPAGIGVFQHSRHFVMTGNALPGYETLGAFGDDLETWYRESFPELVPTQAAPVMLTLEDRDIVDRIRAEKNGTSIGVALLDGDNTGYDGYSDARFALASKCCFYTDDAEQIARILLDAGLFKAADREHDHERKARIDAEKAVKGYSGPRYDPSWTNGPRLITPPPTAVDPDLEGKSADELRAIIRQQTAIIAAEHTARIAAEKRANTLSIERSGILHILRNGDLGAERLTGFAIALDLHARIANGEQPTPAGFKAPAKRYAEMTGQSEGTVAKHMRLLSKDPKTGEGKDLIPKCVIRERTEREIEGETIDHSSGEIRTERETVRGLRDVNYVAVPDGKVRSLIDRLRTYQRPEGETGHGGKRETRPACEHHPDAGTYTVKHEHIECAACHAILEKSEPKCTYHSAEDPADLDDESSGIKMTPVDSSVVNVLSGSKMTPELDDLTTADATDSIMQLDPLQTCVWPGGCVVPVPPGATRCRDHALDLEEYDRRYGVPAGTQAVAS